MKWGFGLLLILGIFAFQFPYQSLKLINSQNKEKIKLIIEDRHDGKILSQATINLYEKNKLILSGTTNTKGIFQINKKLYGNYSIVIIKDKYQKTKYLDVKIDKNTSKLTLLVQKNKTELEESVVKNWNPTSNDDSKVRSYLSIAKSKTLLEKEDVAMPSSTMYDEKAASKPKMSIAVGGCIKPGSKIKPDNCDVASGQMTAGEYNELDNWGHWNKLLKNDFAQFANNWNIYMNNRVSIQLIGAKDQPIVDAAIVLKNSKNEILWESKTNNFGKAELWAGLNNGQKINELDCKLYLKSGKNNLELLNPKSGSINYNGNLNVIKVDQECTVAPKNADVVFVVDATGSMGDEINYLKSELIDVAKRIEENNKSVLLRMGSVFYRDDNDEYLVKSSPLTSGHHLTAEFIKNQFAGGGGDFPEAVDAALDEAIYQQKWSENAIARIIFLVLDAPPHQNAEVIAQIQSQIRAASKLGIRIIPITASGIDRSTEFIMKSLAVATGSTYTFITDHSGIGGSHLAPTADKYDVEKLNDLLVRIVNQAVYSVPCDQNIENRNSGNLSATAFSFFPNPTNDVVNIEISEPLDEIALLNTNGQVIKRLEQPAAGNYIWFLKDLPSAAYVIRFSKDGKVDSKQLVLVNS